VPGKSVIWLIVAVAVAACSDEGIDTRVKGKSDMNQANQRLYQSAPAPQYPVYQQPARPQQMPGVMAPPNYYQSGNYANQYPGYVPGNQYPEYGPGNRYPRYGQSNPGNQPSGQYPRQPPALRNTNPWITGSVPDPTMAPPARQNNIWSGAGPRFSQQPKFRPLEEKQENIYPEREYVAPYDQMQGPSRSPVYPGYGYVPPGYGYGAPGGYAYPAPLYPGIIR